MNRASILQQAEGLGLSAEHAAMLTGGDRLEARLEIHPQNWPALRVFLAVETQWRRAGMNGTPVGLDLATVPVAAAMLGIPADADLLSRLRTIEGEALTAMLEQAA